jgi:F-type H+-transporting ATPase subunit epsilon
MSTIELQIITPQKVVYAQQVDMVITRAAKGDIGILPKHAPLVSTLAATKVRIKKDETEEIISISGGFLEVTPAKVTILAEAAELPGDIDLERAKLAKERAQKRIKDGDGDLDRAELALKRALTRIDVAKPI